MASAEVYDPATGRWSSTGSMHSAGGHAATLLADGRVLVAGTPSISGNSREATAELYDPATGRWSVTGSLAGPRYDHTATLLRNGKVLVTGGGPPAEETSVRMTTELYDPATGRWSRTGDLADYHFYGDTATLLPDGTVLLAGGTDPRLPVDAAEVYDPVTGVWRDAGRMTAGRDYHTATLLPDGRVVVAGGLPGRLGPSLASAELYTPDTRAPVTTVLVSPAPNAAGWNRDPVTVSLQAVDEADGSGVQDLTYSATGAEAIAPTTVAEAHVLISLGAEGVTTLSYFARDEARNVEATGTLVVRIDRTSPALQMTDLSVPATSAAGALVKRYPVSATDNLDPRPAVTCFPLAPHLFAIDAPGVASTVACTATDRAGNTARRSFRLHVAGAAEQIAALGASLAAMALPRKVARPLDRDLAKALRALGNPRRGQVCRRLERVLRRVAHDRQHGTLSEGQAAQLATGASRIADIVGCRSNNDDELCLEKPRWTLARG